MSFKNIWRALLQCKTEIAMLENRAEKLANNYSNVLAGKRSLFIQTKEISFVEDELTSKESSLIQNTEGLSVVTSVSIQVDYSRSDVYRRVAVPQSLGFRCDEFGRLLFDFDWNLSLASSQLNYLQAQEGSQWASSKSIGNFYTPWNQLNFKRPYVMGAGEFLTLAVKPIRYAFPNQSGKQADNTYHVVFNFIGYKVLGVKG